MNLQLGQALLPVHFIAGPQLVSPHSRRRLRTGTLTFSVSDPSLLEALEAAKGQTLLVMDDDGSTINFQVTSSTFTYIGGGPPWNQRIDVAEVEKLSPSAILMAGLRLVPYEYEERPERSGIVIMLKAELERSVAEQTKERVLLYKTYRYFNVIREGIEAEPRQMRFGRGFHWSEKNGIFRVELVLVEKIYDETPDPDEMPDIFPELGPTMRQLARTKAFDDLLAQKLVEKGLLSNDELETIRQGSEAREWAGVWELHRLDEISRRS